jgi:transposase-like protein
LKLAILRDQRARFELQLLGKYQRRLPGFGDYAISMYARAMSVRETQGHLLGLYGLQVSPDLIVIPRLIRRLMLAAKNLALVTYRCAPVLTFR